MLNVQPTILVWRGSSLPELTQEETDVGARGAGKVSQRFLIFPEVGSRRSERASNVSVSLWQGYASHLSGNNRSQRYFEEIFLSSGCARKRGLTSSIRTICPISCKGPSNCTKLGGASTMIQQV